MSLVLYPDVYPWVYQGKLFTHPIKENPRHLINYIYIYKLNLVATNLRCLGSVGHRLRAAREREREATVNWKKKTSNGQMVGEEEKQICCSPCLG
jgi:hypothetical protein